MNLLRKIIACSDIMRFNEFFQRVLFVRLKTKYIANQAIIDSYCDK